LNNPDWEYVMIYCFNGVGRRGFALVEVLIVVGVIIVLLGLSIPAVSMARAAAARSKCGNHLRQIGAMAGQYQADRKGYVMPGNVSTSGNSVAWQPFLNVEYAQVKPWLFQCPGIRPVEGEKTGFFQPAKSSTVSPFDKADYSSLTRASYVMNVIPPHSSSGFTAAGSSWGTFGTAFSTRNPTLTNPYDASVIRGWTGAAPGAASNAKDTPIKASRADRMSSAIYIVDHRPDHFDGVTNNAANMTNAFLDGVYQFETTDWGSNTTSTGTPRVKVGIKVHNNAYNAVYGDGHGMVIDSVAKSDPEAWIVSAR
jgi:type II secretory pathway pseudopilin PulG